MEEFSTEAQRKKGSRRTENGDPGDLGESSWVLREPEESPNHWDETDERADEPPRGAAGANSNDNPALSLLGIDAAEDETRPSAIDIRRLIVGVWKRRLLVSVITMLITALFLAIAIFLVSKDWTAKTILIKKQQIDQFQVGGGAYPYEPQNYSFETMLATLKLPTVLQTTLERSGIDVLPRVLSAQTSVERGRNSNLLEISVTWDSPETAALLANNLVAVFIDSNRAMRRDEAAVVYNYYATELERVETTTTALDKQIQDYRRANKVINFDRQTEAALRKITDLQVEHRSMKAELDELRRTESDLQKLIDATPEMAIQTTLYRNPLKKKKSDLEWSLQEMRGRYTDQNPKVIDLLDQIASLEKIIAEGGDEDTPENIYAPNPIRSELLMKQLENNDKISIKSALVNSLYLSLEEAQKDLRDLTESQQAFTALYEERESMTDLLNNLRNRVEEARIIMQSNQSDFEIVEVAKLPFEANPSPRKLIAIAGVVLGGGFAVFIALLLEFLDPRVRTAKELQAITGVNNLFEIQRIPEGLSPVADLAHPDAEVLSLARRILNDLESQLGQGALDIIAVSSIDREEGRSSIAHNLAVISALKGVDTVLIDADLSENAGERVERQLAAQATELPGVADILAGQAALEESVSPTHCATLTTLAAGGKRGRSAVLALSSKRMKTLLRRLSRPGRRLVIDLPPVAKYEPVFELLHHLGAMVLVARSGQTDKRRLKAFADRAERSSIRIDAVILTDVDPAFSTEQRQFSLRG